MDTFNEQLISIKPTAKTWAVWALTVILTLAVIAACLLFIGFLGALAILIIAGVIYLAYYIVSRQNIEYEYIFTNGDLDIDKITAKQSRKRIASFDCRDLTFIAPYTDKNAEKGDMILCNKGDGMYKLKGYRKNGSPASVVITPNKKILEDIKRYLPMQMRGDI